VWNKRQSSARPSARPNNHLLFHPIISRQCCCCRESAVVSQHPHSPHRHSHLSTALNEMTARIRTLPYAEYSGMERRTEYRTVGYSWVATCAFFANLARWKFPHENRLVEISRESYDILACEWCLNQNKTLVLVTVFQRWPFQFFEYCCDTALLFVVIYHESCRSTVYLFHLDFSFWKFGSQYSVFSSIQYFVCY